MQWHLRWLCSVSNYEFLGVLEEADLTYFKVTPENSMEYLSVTSDHPHKVPVLRADIQSWYLPGPVMSGYYYNAMPGRSTGGDKHGLKWNFLHVDM